MSTKTTQKTRKMVFLAMMIAITVVLQVVSNFVKFGPIAITLALVPVIIGGAIYGWKTGAVLGFVFSAVLYISGMMGLDGGTVIFYSTSNGVFSAIATPILILLKGTVAGIGAGIVYKLAAKKSSLLGVILAGITAPVLNTGIFVLGTVTIFRNTLGEGSLWVVLVALLSAIALNFIVEFAANLVLSTVIERIITISKKNKFNA